jgi:hypothetical protein
MTTQHNRATKRVRALVLVLALAAGGCATGGRTVETEMGASRDVEVTVENQNFKDAVVYAIWGAGPRGRLGMVTGNTTQTFTTAVRGSGEMRVEVDLIAGNAVVTERIGVYQGEEIHVVIPPSI